MSRKIKDQLCTMLIWLAATFSVGVLVLVVGFIFSKGWSKISVDFLFNDYESKTQYVNLESNQVYIAPSSLSADALFLENLGAALELNGDHYEVVWIDKESPLKEATNNADEKVRINKGDHIQQIKVPGKSLTLDETVDKEGVIQFLGDANTLVMKVMSTGGGIFPMIISTLLLVFVALLFSAPIGILAAIYLVEYAKPGRLVNTIRFATEILAGIPSVVYGLFGMLMFVNTLNLGMSILAGGLTLTILLLPTMMRTTEEALKVVPMSYREASYGLGANKIQTLSKVVLPSAIPGILVGIILSIGRIIGESAALLFTIGTFAKLPVNPSTGSFSLFETGTSLTVRAYIEVKESGNVEMAAAIGIVILIVVFTLNILSRLVAKKFSKVND